MSPEQFLLLVLAFSSSTLSLLFSLLLLLPSRRARRRHSHRKPLPRDQDPDWRRSFNHDNTNKKPASASRPLLFRRRPPEVTQ